MPVTIDQRFRDFSPAEAERATGLSVAGQRDWRRRGLLPETPKGKWTRFSLEEIIKIAVMKSFSDAGFSVSAASDAAEMAVLPTLATLVELPNAVHFQGDDIPQNIRELSIRHAIRAPAGRFVVMLKTHDGNDESYRISDLNAVEKLTEEASTFLFTVIDCELLAEMILFKAEMPLIYFSAKNNDLG